MNRDNLLMYPVAFPDLMTDPGVAHFMEEDGSYVGAYLRMHYAAKRAAEQCMAHHECTVMESGSIRGIFTYYIDGQYDPHFGVWKLDTSQ